MSKKCKVNWLDINGVSPKPKRLHLKRDEANSLFHCLIQECDHDGFQSQRGCRKHVNMLSGVALPTHIRVGLESPSRGSLGIILQTGY